MTSDEALSAITKKVFSIYWYEFKEKKFDELKVLANLKNSEGGKKEMDEEWDRYFAITSLYEE